MSSSQGRSFGSIGERRRTSRSRSPPARRTADDDHRSSAQGHRAGQREGESSLSSSSSPSARMRVLIHLHDRKQAGRALHSSQRPRTSMASPHASQVQSIPSSSAPASVGNTTLPRATTSASAIHVSDSEEEDSVDDEGKDASFALLNALELLDNSRQKMKEANRSYKNVARFREDVVHDSHRDEIKRKQREAKDASEAYETLKGKKAVSIRDAMKKLVRQTVEECADTSATTKSVEQGTSTDAQVTSDPREALQTHSNRGVQSLKRDTFTEEVKTLLFSFVDQALAARAEATVEPPPPSSPPPKEVFEVRTKELEAQISTLSKRQEELVGEVTRLRNEQATQEAEERRKFSADIFRFVNAKVERQAEEVRLMKQDVEKILGAVERRSIIDKDFFDVFDNHAQALGRHESFIRQLCAIMAQIPSPSPQKITDSTPLPLLSTALHKHFHALVNAQSASVSQTQTTTNQSTM